MSVLINMYSTGFKICVDRDTPTVDIQNSVTSFLYIINMIFDTTFVQC